VNLLIGVPLESFLAIALLSSRQTIAPMYSLSSTHAGAGVLWVLTELLTVVAVIPIYFQWMASEDRKTAREDARLDAEAARAGSIETRDAAVAQATCARGRTTSVPLHLDPLRSKGADSEPGGDVYCQYWLNHPQHGRRHSNSPRVCLSPIVTSCGGTAAE